MASVKISRPKRLRAPTEENMTKALVKLIVEGPNKLTDEETFSLGESIGKVGKKSFIIESDTDGDWDNNIEPKTHKYKVSITKIN